MVIASYPDYLLTDDIVRSLVIRYYHLDSIKVKVGQSVKNLGYNTVASSDLLLKYRS